MNFQYASQKYSLRDMSLVESGDMMKDMLLLPQDVLSIDYLYYNV